MATTNKKQELIYIGIDDKVVELTGAEKDAFILDRQKINETNALIEAEHKRKQETREKAIKKLAEIAGLTDEEIAAII